MQALSPIIMLPNTLKRKVKQLITKMHVVIYFNNYTSSTKTPQVDGFLLTGLPPFIIQTLEQVGFTAWRTREKRAQRVQQ